MKSKSTLYELLGVSSSADAVELQGAYRRALAALEGRRAVLTSEEFREREQVLRVAHSTLRNPSLRADYDAELAAAERAARAAVATSKLVTREAARADALGLRADALALRADAIMARAEVEGALARPPSAVAALLSGANGLARVIGLLVIIGASAFGLTRCASGDQGAHRAALEARAAEQIRLQEYAQTYGVRPANIAELERMEAERQRREIETRQADQERRRREEDKRRWEEEVRRASESVTYNIQQAQNAERLKAEQARELKFREEQLLLELQYAGTDAARQRIELQIRQLRERRGQP